MIKNKNLLRRGALGVVLVLVLSFVFTPLTNQSVSAVGGAAGGDSSGGAASGASSGSGSGDKSDSSNNTSCAIDKIGWILCPVMEKIAWISDNAFKVLADNFLQTDAQLVTDNIGGHENGTKVAWNVALNIANIMFVIAFLIIILSQVTGYGLSNYGVKRMIPRLVVAAILVNTSYFICQLAVDLSNLLGYAIQDSLKSIANEIGPSVFGNASNYDNTVGTKGIISALPTANGIITVIVGAALASAVLVWISLPAVISIVPMILITVVTIILILMMRKAIIVLLVVISPIAFVMYLLPNTEKFFTKWRTMFVQLLMVFPVVALLFGAGQLASTIILVAGASDTNCVPTSSATNASTTSNSNNATPTNCLIQVGGGASTGGSTNNSTVRATWTTGLIATAVAVAPLLAVWSVLKGALSAAGTIGGRISGAIEKGVGTSGKFLGDKAGQGIGEQWHKSVARGGDAKANRFDKFANYMQGRDSKREFRRNTAKSSMDRILHNQLNDELHGGESSLLRGLPTGEKSRLERYAAAAHQKQLDEETAEALTTIENDPSGKLQGAQDAMKSAIGSQDMTVAKAAIQALMTTGEKGVGELQKQLDDVMIHATTAGGKEFAKNISEYIMQAHPNMKEKNSAIEMWASNYRTEAANGRSTSVTDWAQEEKTYSRLNDAQFSGQIFNSMDSAGAKLALAAKSLNAAGELETRGARLLSNPESSRNLDDGKRGIISKAIAGK